MLFVSSRPRIQVEFQYFERQGLTQEKQSLQLSCSERYFYWLFILSILMFFFS